MKLTFLYTFFFVSTNCFSADSIDFQQQKAFAYLNDSSENLIGISCSWAAKPTSNLHDLDFLIQAKRFDLITKLLYSKIPATRFLSALTLLLVDKKSIWKMDSTSLKKINEIKLSNDTINACYGCLSGYSSSISSMFTKFRKPKIYNHSKKWILNSLNEIE